MKVFIQRFMCLVESGEVEVYNEFSLQHELGIYLREQLKQYKVQFERNTKFFGISGTVKHEIDIVVYNAKEKYAIELKYPVNGQYPEQMFSFIKDVSFMEELKNLGFTGTYCLTMVNDKNFYTGKRIDGIYAYFRSNAEITGKIVKPTGKKDDMVYLEKKYRIEWCGETSVKYYIISI